MSEYNLFGGPRSIRWNSANTVGAFAHQGVTDNQTRSGYYTTSDLVEWAKAIEGAYGENETVEVVFTPNKPMVATEFERDTEMSIGIGVAPLLEPDDYEETKGDSE